MRQRFHVFSWHRLYFVHELQYSAQILKQSGAFSVFQENSTKVSKPCECCVVHGVLTTRGKLEDGLRCSIWFALPHSMCAACELANITQLTTAIRERVFYSLSSSSVPWCPFLKALAFSGLGCTLEYSQRTSCRVTSLCPTITENASKLLNTWFFAYTLSLGLTESSS